MENGLSFAPLLLVLLLAFSVPLLLSRFKKLLLPVVVGEILAGILVGRSGFNWVEGQDPVLSLLAEFGFVFLMFISGMEIDLSNIGMPGGRNRKNNLPNSHNNRLKWISPISLGLINFFLTLIISGVIGLGMVAGGLARNPWMIALILSTTSLGVVLPVLKEAGLSTGRYGQAVLIAALVADFATMLLITVLVAVISHGITVDILLIGLLFVGFFLAYRIGNLFLNRLPPVRRAIEELSHATTQIKVRAAFTIMLTFVVLAQILGTELILGAFLAGAVVSMLRTPDDENLTTQLEAIGFGFFIPIFFIKVGLDFNLQLLLASPQNLVLVPALLVAALLVKFLPALVFRLCFSWRETFAAGAILSSRLSLIIAASAIGLRLGIISESVNSTIILVAIITVTLAPIAFTALIHRGTSGTIHPILVAGASELGIQVATQLSRHQEQVVVIDFDEKRAALAHQRGLQSICGRIGNASPEIDTALNSARALICTYGDPELNYQVCNQARTVYGLDQVISYIDNPNDLIRFELLGVTAVNAALDRATLLTLAIRNPALYQLFSNSKTNKEIREIEFNNPKYENSRLRELSLPGDVLVVALYRHGELIVPHGNTRIVTGDHLTLMGSLEHIEATQTIFNV
jgi:Kef-type K+ transport system membrane component KefB/Trk K+ transport system NAD-binding subunit